LNESSSPLPGAQISLRLRLFTRSNRHQLEFPVCIPFKVYSTSTMNYRPSKLHPPLRFSRSDPRCPKIPIALLLKIGIQFSFWSHLPPGFSLFSLFWTLFLYRYWHRSFGSFVPRMRPRVVWTDLVIAALILFFPSPDRTGHDLPGHPLPSSFEA